MNRRITMRAAVPYGPTANGLASVELSLLSDQKRAEFSECESMIEKHLKALYEAGKALLHIRDILLYSAEFPRVTLSLAYEAPGGRPIETGAKPHVSH